MRRITLITCFIIACAAASAAGSTTSLPLDRWQRFLVDENLPWNALFVLPADINGDGKLDIAAGESWYEGSGQIGQSWSRHAIGEGFNNVLAAHDFDSDGDADLIGTVGQPDGGDFLWARNDGKGNFTLFRNLDPAKGDFVQGVTVGKFDDDALKVALSWHKNGGGVTAFTVPADPANEQWKLSLLSSASEEEDLAAGDIDRDGDLDLLLGVTWIANDNGQWTLRTMGQIADLSPKGQPDRNALSDIDGDGDLDAVVALEEGTPLVWFEQVDVAKDLWTRHQVADVPGQGFSMEVADMDGDGDPDIILGEHRNKPNRLLLFENQDAGKAWAEHVLDTDDGIGIDHHDGAIPVDLDKDGDMDILSLGWKNKKVWIFENLAVASTTGQTSASSPAGPLAGPRQASAAATKPAAKKARPNARANRRQNAAAKNPGAKNPGAKNPGARNPGSKNPGAKNAAAMKRMPAAAATAPAPKPDAGAIEPIAFRKEVIDAAPLGREMDITLIGDIDGDGKQDVVIGGKSGESNLAWYQAPDWKRRPMASNVALEAGGFLFDINADGRLDVIAGAPGNGPNLYWFENPADLDAPWTQRIIENTFKKYHDQTVGDIDNDGKPELLFSSQKAGVVAYYDIPADPTVEPWPADNRHIIRKDAPNLEGLVIADLNGDGKNETVIGSLIFTLGETGEWSSKNIAPQFKEARAAVGDFNKDGAADIVLTEGERHPARMAIFAGPDYRAVDLETELSRPHSLGVADMNQDGLDDIMVGEMGPPNSPEAARIFIYLGKGDGTFDKRLASSGTSTHETKVADLNGDGKPDIVGKPYTKEQMPVDLWVNEVK